MPADPIPISCMCPRAARSGPSNFWNNNVSSTEKTMSKERVLLPVIALLSLAIGPFAAADVLDKSATINGTTVRYKVVLPKDFDAAKNYPEILAFPPGGQDMDMVNATLNGNFRAQAEQRGYIVVEPAAPNGLLFFEGSEKIFPAFLTKLLGDYKIVDNKFNVAGNSNGGLSAFLVAANHPQYFWSVTGFPGFLDNGTPQQIAALGKMCIHMFAGELDS